jgi:amino acid adenylation domain-containing protein
VSESVFPLATVRPSTPTYRRAQLSRDSDADHRELAAAVALAVIRYREVDEVDLAYPVLARSGDAELTTISLSLGPDPSFAQALAAVDAAVAGTYDTPVAHTGRSPACIVASTDGPWRTLDEHDLRRRFDRLAARSDLFLAIDSATRQIRCDYSLDAFTPRAADLTFGHVVSALAEGRANGAKPVSAYEFASEEEQQELAESARAEQPSPPDSIHRRFAAQASATPDAVAVIAGGQRLTYRALDRRSDRLAARLRSRGLGRGHRVGLLMERSPELVIAMIAVLKAGCAYIPMDVRVPLPRHERIATSAEMAFVLRTDPAVPVPPGVPYMDLPAEDGESLDWHEPSSYPEDHAYVLFTSGSTGEPKGVAVSHRSVVRLFDTTREAFGFDSGTVWLNSAEATFDASVWEIYGALLHGGCVVIAPRDVVRDPEALVQLVVASHVSVMTMSPTAFVGFRDAANSLPGTTALRHVVLCAEALNPRELEPWYERWDDSVELVNMYGITETTVHSTLRRLTRGDARSARSVIGRGLPDTPVYVLDTRGRLAPFGMPGEIHVGGPGVAARYLVAPAADNSRFMPDPYAAYPGAMMYRSGDKARVLPDGDIEYLGRLDRQVKIRGYRIELGEVEAALLSHPGVTSARAWSVAREGLPPLLAAAVVAAPGGSHGPEAWRGHVQERLPDYMVPSAWVRLDGLPLTPNGKLDLAALNAALAREADSEQPATAAAAVRDPIETHVVEAMRDVLGIAAIGPEDGFFEGGGDSITAIRLVAALRRIGYADADVAKIYSHRNARAIGRALRGAAVDTGADVRGVSYAPSPLGTHDSSFPATRLQWGMFLHGTLDGEHVYHDVLSYTIDDVFEQELLERALAAVVETNPILRASFHVDGPDRPIIRLHTDTKISVGFTDLSGHAPSDREALIERWAQAERNTPFVWTTPGLMRIHVHQTADACSVLSLSVHHAILDGWSAATFVSELLATYATLREGRVPARKRDSGLLQRYARLEEGVERAPEHQEFWSGYLLDADPTRPAPPSDFSMSDPGGAETARAVLDAGLVARVRETARSIDVPVKTVYTAAHVAAMSLISGSGEVLTGRIVNGRIEDEGGDEVLGLFLNTVPLRIDLHEMSWVQLLGAVYDDEVRVAPHRRLPYERIQQLSGHSRLCPTALNYTDFHVYRRLEGTGLRVREVRYREDTDFPMLVAVHEDPHGAATDLTVTYKTREMSADQAAAYLRCFVELLEHIDVSDETAVVEVALSRAGQRGETLEVSAGSTKAAPQLIDLINRRASSFPDAIVLAHNGRTWSLADTMARARKVAQRLADCGLTRGARVAVLPERGADPVFALLGTWAAGGVYVPLDPALPLERLRTMLAIAGCRHALVSNAHVEHGLLKSLDFVVELSDDEEPSRPDAGGSAEPEPDDEAYVLFTSGSTGEPKAVAMPHRAMDNLIHWQLRQPEFATPARVSQFAPLAFDVSIQEMLTALASGSTLVVADEQARRNAQETLRFMADERIEVAFLPPVALRQLIAARKAFDRTPNSLRCVITAGEALVIDEDAREFFAAADSALVNQYGPTETHVVAAHRLVGPPERWPRLPAVGFPIDNIRLRVLDQYGRPVLRHATGELHVAGDGVALGYVDARHSGHRGGDRFGRDPEGAREYRTGDLVRLGPYGLEFVSRSDSQVKIRGFRVEPGEVAAAVLRHPSVADCVVRAVELESGGEKTLVAYVVGSGADVTEERVREHAARLLPDFAVPRFVQVLDRLPLTTSGKVDLLALRPPRAIRSRPGPAETISPIEREVLEVWEQVLGAPVRSPSMTFFEAGGTSLLLLNLYLRLRSRFDLDFAMHELFRSPTARDFAALLAGQTGDRHIEPFSPVARDRIAAVASLRLAARRGDRQR